MFVFLMEKTMHKLYNVHNKSEITLDSKQQKVLQTSGINFTL